MSLNPDPFEPVRLEFHIGKLFTGQDTRGAEKTYNDLRRAYQIAILVKEQFFSEGNFFHSFEYYDPVRRVSLDGRTRILTLELSKLENVAKKPTAEMSAQELWAVYFRYLKDNSMREKINEILAREEGKHSSRYSQFPVLRYPFSHTPPNRWFRWCLGLVSKTSGFSVA